MSRCPSAIQIVRPLESTADVATSNAFDGSCTIRSHTRRGRQHVGRRRQREQPPDLPASRADAPPIGMGRPPDHVDRAVRDGVIRSYRLVAPEVTEKSCKFIMQKSFVTGPKTWRDILVPCWRDRPAAPLL